MIIGNRETPEGWSVMPVKAPNDYAIVVGVDEYEDAENIPTLRGAVNDARLFKRWLLDPNGGGLDPDEPAGVTPPKVQVICSPSPQVRPHYRPVKEEIEQALLNLIRPFLLTGRQVGRRLYLYFSGHGMTPQSSSEECALLMANASYQLQTLGLSIPGRRAADSFRKRAIFGEVVLFMDCCRHVPGVAESSLSFPLQEDPTLGNVKWLYGFATRWAALAAEKVLPDPLTPNGDQSVHGVFTHALLEGFKSAVDPAGQVTSASLARYVRERAQQLLPQADNQRPEFYPPHQDPPIIFGAGTPTVVRVILDNPAGGFAIRDGNWQPVNPPRVRIGPNQFEVQLIFGQYLFAAGPDDDDADWKIVKIFGGPKDVQL